MQPIKDHDPLPVSENSPLREGTTWKILAEEAAQEQDPDKLLEIVNALNRAFDEEQARRNRHSGTTRPR